MTRQKGAALLLVLWATVLLAALLLGFAASSRSHAMASLYGAERVRAAYAAEAGLARAIAGLRAPGLRDQWVPDGRPYAFDFGGAKVTVRVVDVSGMVDLNAAPPELLRNLFESSGLAPGEASATANAVVAWRGGAPSMQANAGVPGANAGPSHGPFRAIEQLAQIPGMTPARLGKLERAVTVFSGRNFPDASYAGPLVLAALRGLDVRRAETLVQGRRQRPAQRGAGNGRAFGAVANGPLVAGYGGVVERVYSVAEMPDGTRAGLDVTVRMALTATRARPYKVLDWRADTVDAP